MITVRQGTEAEYEAFARAEPTALAQQTAEWGRVVRAVGQDEPRWLLALDGSEIIGALMAFRFRGPLGDVMISVPQAGGYGGVVAKEGTEAAHEALLPAFVEMAKNEGCMLATISTSPFFADRDLYCRHLRPDFVRENFVQFIPLDADSLALHGAPGKAGQDFRRKLRRSEAIRVSMDDEDAHFEAWYALHQKRMGELSAAPLPRALFMAARTEMVAKGLGFFAYGFDADRLVAGALFIGHGRVLDVFMLSGDSEAAALQGNTAVVAAAVRRAHAEGYEVLNWQSSSSKTSSVYRYKASWGSRDGTHHYLTCITGDLKLLREAPMDVLRERYRWHYLLPYEALGR